MEMNVGFLSIEELRGMRVLDLRNLGKRLGLKGLSGKRKAGLIAAIEKEYETIRWREGTSEVNVQRQSSNSEIYLPLSQEEFIFMWEGGFICHPHVLYMLLAETGVEMPPSKYEHLDSAEWHELLSFGGELRVVFEKEPSKLDAHWRKPLSEILRVEVSTLGAKQDLIRKLGLTHQQGNSNLMVSVSNGAVPVDAAVVGGKDILGLGMGVGLEAAGDSYQSDDVVRDVSLTNADLDALLGSVAMAAHLERYLLVNGGLNSAVPGVGWLGAGLEGSEQWEERLKVIQCGRDRVGSEIFRFIEKVQIAQKSNKRCEWDIRIMLSEWKSGEGDFEGLWLKASDGLSEEIRSGIARLMGRGYLNDAVEKYHKDLNAWQLYVLCLWKHQAVRNRSSNARQSLLNSIYGFVDGQQLDCSKLYMMAVYHGWQIGYQLCWAPATTTLVERFGANDEWWALKLNMASVSRIVSVLVGSSQSSRAAATTGELALNSGEILKEELGVIRKKDIDVERMRRLLNTGSILASDFSQLWSALAGLLSAWPLPSDPEGNEAADIAECLRSVEVSMRNDESGWYRFFLRSLIEWLRDNHGNVRP